MNNMHRSAAARTHRWPAVAALVLALLALGAGVAQPVVVAGVQDTPVTLYQWSTNAVPNLDPQQVDNPTSADIVENLFLGLTSYDPETGEILPELATAWRISSSGRTFTFTLRDDVYWVRYDPNTQITARVRPVTAQDFVSGLQRACSLDGGEAAALLVPIVEGCGDVYNTATEDLTPDVLAQVGARAPAPDTLIVRLQEPAGWFLSITPVIRPAPLDIIERYGAAWTMLGNLVTTGPFVLTRSAPGQLVFERANLHLPADVQGAGNVARVVYDAVRDTNAGFSLYLEHKVDTSPLPAAEVSGFVGQRPDEAELVPDQRVAYLGFTNSRAPFNDVRVRRAFAAALDREAFVRDVLNGAGVPMTHIAPSGVFGAPPVGSVGLGYDPEFAREQFAEAGYRGCARFPYVTLVAHESTATWVDFMVESWGEVLGCHSSVFQVRLVDFPTLLARTGPDASYLQQPHLFTLAWRGEYPDENNWVGDLLRCDADPRTRRACADVDDLIAQAADATNATQRRALYAQIEAAFFGDEGEMPLVPLYQHARWEAVKPWVSRPPQVDGALVGRRWDQITIDQSLQLRCRSKGGADASECTAPMIPLPQPATATLTPTPTLTPTVTPTRGDGDSDTNIPLGWPTVTPAGEFNDVSIPVTPTRTVP